MNFGLGLGQDFQQFLLWPKHASAHFYSVLAVGQ